MRAACWPRRLPAPGRARWERGGSARRRLGHCRGGAGARGAAASAPWLSWSRAPRALPRGCRGAVMGLLAARGVAAPAGAPASDLAAILETSLGVPSSRLAAALDGTRFGPEARAAESALRLRGELDALRRRLRERLRTSQRLRGFLSLRSLRAAA